VGSEMCIRDSCDADVRGWKSGFSGFTFFA
jgi:hypothetical protein